MSSIRCRRGTAPPSDAWQVASSALADREARAQALSELQAKIGSGKDAAAWFSARGLEHARRLWQQLDIERGWEDALEAVLRERLNALEMPSLDAVLSWTGDETALPGRIAAYVKGTSDRAAKRARRRCWARCAPSSPN